MNPKLDNLNSPEAKFIDTIMKLVSNNQNIPVEYFGMKTRKREIVQARQMAMYLSCKYTNCSLATIGTKIGRKDHATVLHAKKVILNLIDTDKKVRESIDLLSKELDMTNPGENLLVCKICGKPNVKEKAWINPNSGMVIREDLANEQEREQFCIDCDKPTEIMPMSEHDKYQRSLILQAIEKQTKPLLDQARVNIAEHISGTDIIKAQEYEYQLNNLEKELGI